MYEEYDSVRFFFFEPSFFGFFSDFLAGVFFAGGMLFVWFDLVRDRGQTGGVVRNPFRGLTRPVGALSTPPPPLLLL